MDFVGFQKIPRLSRKMVISEKIDGTNGQIFIQQDENGCIELRAGSRSKWLTLDNDNHGFAKWVFDNADELIAGLGVGRHYGEFWGSGIQRGYGLPKGEKRFSLFNTHRWADDNVRPKCCHVVPILYTGLFNTFSIDNILQQLKIDGSAASPGFMNPEGIVVYHKAGNYLFKKTIENDDSPKSIK